MSQQKPEPPLTLEKLLTLSPPRLSSGKPPKRVRLMRHAFRGYKEQLKKLVKWGGPSLTLEQAYPEKGPIARSSAADVLNAVRMNERLAQLVTAEQGSDCLKEGDLVLVFGATGGKSAEYLAAFEVVQEEQDWEVFRRSYEDVLIAPPESAVAAGLKQHMLAIGAGYNILPHPKGTNYELRRLPDVLRGLERRMVVAWESTVSWHQAKLDKEILELRPKGFVREFTGYLDFTLSFAELRKIVGADASPGDSVWQEKLNAVTGVYIIASQDGRLYVGAAPGKGSPGGFLKRWSDYAGTNGCQASSADEKGLRQNVGMRAFLNAGTPAEQRRRLYGLHFSIAAVMDRSSPAQQVLDAEGWFKEKLGSRAERLGLNRN